MLKEWQLDRYILWKEPLVYQPHTGQCGAGIDFYQSSGFAFHWVLFITFCFLNHATCLKVLTGAFTCCDHILLGFCDYKNWELAELPEPPGPSCVVVIGCCVNIAVSILMQRIAVSVSYPRSAWCVLLSVSKICCSHQLALASVLNTRGR